VPVVPAVRRLSQESHKFKASLSYILGLCLKITKKGKKKGGRKREKEREREGRRKEGRRKRSRHVSKGFRDMKVNSKS
jgi:hypothetical protein